jgi:hypothetical protein
MPRTLLTTEEKKEKNRLRYQANKEKNQQKYQEKKDWINAYTYARRHGLDIYEVCRERGVVIPDTYEKKKKTNTQTREEILAIASEYRRKKIGAIRTIQAFFRRFIARKEKERKATQTEEVAREKKRIANQKKYHDTKDLAEIVGCSYREMNVMVSDYYKATGRSVFKMPDYFKDIPITPY